MEQAKIISSKFLVLFFDFVLLLNSILKKIKVSKRGYKGNLFSLFFEFFISLIILISRFEYKNLKVEKILGVRIIRSLILLLSFLLFSLVTIETNNNNCGAFPQEQYILKNSCEFNKSNRAIKFNLPEILECWSIEDCIVTPIDVFKGLGNPIYLKNCNFRV